MAAWETLPIFYGSSDQIDNASDLNAIRRAAGLIEGWTFRNEAAFDSSTGLDTGAPLYYSTETPLRIWWGAARFVAGCTTLTVEGRGALTGSESWKVYYGGTEVSGSGTLAGTITLPGSIGNVSGAFSISGYSDGDVVPIEIRVEGAHTAGATYIIHDVYLSPVAKSGWVAAPSFAAVADATNATKLNDLCTALQWMYDRLRLVPFVPRLGMYVNLGPFKTGDPQHTNRPMFTGTVGKYYSNAELRIYGAVNSFTTTGWNYTVYLDGVLVHTSATYGIGTQVIDLRLSLASYTLGNRVRVTLQATCSNQGTAQPLRFTRWTIGTIHAVADSGGWPYASLPASFPTPTTTITAETVRSRLASIATIVNNAKTRIDARPEQWARSRAHRRHYTRNAADEELLLARARPFFMQRTGSELFVKGSDIKLAFGPITVTHDEQFNGFEKYVFEHEEGVDAVNGTTVFLDNYKGLDYGSAFRILGSPVYAAEYVG
jgi:hypothetical protein